MAGKEIDVIYDFDSQIEQTPTVFYEDKVIPKTELHPTSTRELEEMFVDEKYKLSEDRITPYEHQILTELRGYFTVGEFVTYQQIMDYLRKYGRTLKIDHLYAYPAFPLLTRAMNHLWRAGLIKKYRRGLWFWQARKKEASERHGVNHGVTYWLWNSER